MDIEQLNKTPHNQICDLARDRFIEVYNQKFGEGGEVFFEEQKAFFNEELLNGSFKGYLEKAPSLNIHDAFMNLAINGLSLEKGTTTLCYLMGYSNYDKNTRQTNYTAKITYTGYGEILLRQRAGQIIRCDNPVVVYDCDDFRFGERDDPKLKVGLGALLQADIDTQTQQKPSQEAFGACDVAPEDKGVKVKVDSDSPF